MKIFLTNFEALHLRIFTYFAWFARFGNSLGSGVTGEVFEVSVRESTHVVKRFNALSIDREYLRRNFSRLAGMDDAHGTPRILV